MKYFISIFILSLCCSTFCFGQKDNGLTPGPSIERVDKLEKEVIENERLIRALTDLVATQNKTIRMMQKRIDFVSEETESVKGDLSNLIDELNAIVENNLSIMSPPVLPEPNQ